MPLGLVWGVLLKPLKPKASVSCRLAHPCWRQEVEAIRFNDSLHFHSEIYNCGPQGGLPVQQAEEHTAQSPEI